MVKILQNIVNNQYKNKEEIKRAIEEWTKITKELRHYFFEALEDWADKEKNEYTRENLKYALTLFDRYRIK